MESSKNLPDIKVGGLTRLSSIDFPGHLSAVIFTQGCPWRCGYCHNAPLLDPHQDAVYQWEEILSFLKGRKGLLDGVVFSGGEPTLWLSLADCMRQLRQMGFRVALHTNGAYPERFAQIIREKLVDWVGMDIKASFDDYERITAIPGSGIPVRKSLQILLESSIPMELRTTLHPLLHSPQDIERLAKELALRGASHLILQKCRLKDTLDETIRMKSYNWEPYLKECVSLASRSIPSVSVR
ncbi:anaerobic ribonucleoside-triphosphate reductase activating protein [Candidatus Sumerlaeota bacterium]|nr:anaerobic ribonucleoside-triphosphate reductase activating protein [Candidatus Sumerlaeota bacterium]